MHYDSQIYNQNKSILLYFKNLYKHGFFCIKTRSGLVILGNVSINVCFKHL